MIELAHGGLGSWSLKFKPNAPYRITRKIDYWDHVVITPTRIYDPTITKANLLTLSRFTGRLDDVDYDEDNRTIGGPGALVWLGDHDGKGSFQKGAYSASVYGTAVTDIFTAATNVNGLTNGGGVGPGTLLYESLAATENPRDLFDRLQRLTATEFFVNAQGEFEYGTPTSVTFVQTPQVMLSRGPERFQRGTAGVTNLRSRIRYRKHIREYATDITCDGSSGATGSAGTLFTRPKGFDGSTNAHIQKYITANTTDSTRCSDQAANDMLYVYSTKWEFDIEVDTFDFGYFAKPGDWLYVFDFESELYSSANAVISGGLVAYPVEVRCFGYSNPFRRGMGAYIVKTSDGSNEVWDITDHVLAEDGPCRVQVATQSYTLEQTINRRN